MNKEKLIRIIVLIHKSKIALFLGLILLFFGLGATYQANEDVHTLNNSLYNIATTDGILTDGINFYYVGLYDNKADFSNTTLLNVSQCQALYGGK